MNIAEFYGGRPDRQRSPEIDYGVHWVEREGQRWPTWRVSYVEYTGEVIAVQQSGRLRDAEVRLLGHAPSRDACERMLDGWAEDPQKPIPWAEARLDHWPGGLDRIRGAR